MQDARMKACMEDPEGALAELQDEQRLIARELEQTFVAYDGRLRAAAKRIASLGPAGVTAEERDQLRAEQLELWRLVRRAQASQRSTRELLREREEWQAHEPTAATEGHPDHPDTRVEIISSELRVRGIVPMEGDGAVEVEEVAPGIHALHRPDLLEEAEILAQAREELAADAPAWEPDSDTVLLQEIRTHERELARTKEPADIADLLRSLRDLHASLRLHDRQHGRPRIRWQMGLGQKLTGISRSS
jgi:hypothetical protein